MDSREPLGGGFGGEPEAGPDAPEAIAFRRLFELHFEEVYRFAYRYVRSAETAKDLVHEAFLCLWRQRAQVDALPRRQREVILLRWHQQASYDEIAKTLGISPKTVAIHLGHAFQRLRALLAQTL